MTVPLDLTESIKTESTGPVVGDGPARSKPVGVPSNPVYARVGDKVLFAAQDGVRRGLRPEVIMREIYSDHNVHLNLGELRLLLASRRIPAE